MTPSRRIQAIRSRCTIRRWEYRQRGLARGAWGRFREALALAAEAYAIDEATMATLVAEGFEPDDRGMTLEPPRQIIWVTRERIARGDARRLAMHLDSTMLATTRLALVAF
ncbi:MAG: hypothetical protein ABI867_32730 [Kofleriaceae bacterium]